MPTATGLVLYDSARTALQKAVRVDEVKSIRDRAVAMRAYAKQADDRQMEADAFEIRERATRRLGELVKAQRELPKEQGGGLATPPGRPARKEIGLKSNPISRSPIPTLAEMGIDKVLADRARKLEKIAPEKFERHIESGRERVFSADKAHVSNNCRDDGRSRL